MTEPMGDISERDLAEMQVKGTVKLAAALGGMSGAIAVLSGLQFTTSVSFHDAILNVVPWGLVGLGTIQLGSALLVMRNHFPATIVATVVGFLVALLAVGWAFLASTSGFFSCLAICEVPLAGSAALLAPFALRFTRRAWDAKKRIESSGFELGL